MPETARLIHLRLRRRVRAALHAKIDIVQEDRGLLRALFRYGGYPEHPLSWFGPGTREQRQLSVDVFAEALAGERLPDDVRDAAPCCSRFSFRETARDRAADGFAWRCCPVRESRAACFRVRAEAVPFFGGASFTPARRAFERPIAISCFVERAPCFPSRT